MVQLLLALLQRRGRRKRESEEERKVLRNKASFGLKWSSYIIFKKYYYIFIRFVIIICDIELVFIIIKNYLYLKKVWIWALSPQSVRARLVLAVTLVHLELLLLHEQTLFIRAHVVSNNLTNYFVPHVSSPAAESRPRPSLVSPDISVGPEGRFWRDKWKLIVWILGPLRVSILGFSI